MHVLLPAIEFPITGAEMKELVLLNFPRSSLSDFLQIAKLCEDAGYPLPDVVVEHVVEAHDFMLYKEKKEKNKRREEVVKQKDQSPPCEGCTVARWIRFSCGMYGWECQGNKAGKCGAL